MPSLPDQVAAQRARRWPVVLEHPIHHRLAALIAMPCPDAMALALPLLFDHAAPAGGATPLLRLERHGLAPVELDAEAGTWRCTSTRTTGRGVLELIAWARGCTLEAAACWLYAVRRAARWQVAANLGRAA